MSFFDEGDESPPRASREPSAVRARRPPGGRARGTGEHQQQLIRRGVALAVAIVLLFAVVLGVSSCQRSAQRSALGSYARSVSSIAQNSDQAVASPFFGDLAQAQGKSALAVEVQINQLRLQAQADASRARALDVPGAMTAAQRDLLLSLDLRAGAVGSVASAITTALGGQSAPDAFRQIAGQMEVLLGADVIYSQRVSPLIIQALADGGVSGQSVAPSRWVRDLGWLDTGTVSSRLTGVSGTGANGQALAPGTHGHALAGVSVGTLTLAGTGVNHIPGGASPTFTVKLSNDGVNPETNVTIDVTVVAQGQARTAKHVIDKTLPGQSYSVDVPVDGIPLGAPARVTVQIEPVPGERTFAHNKVSFVALFSA